MNPTIKQQRLFVEHMRTVSSNGMLIMNNVNICV